MARAALLVILVAACSQPPGGGATAPANRPLGDPGATPQRPPPYCFVWIRGDEHRANCFRTEAECEQQRAEPHDGARYVAPACQRLGPGVCTTIARGDQVIEEPERCFDDAGACQRYRDHVEDSGFTTPCSR